MEASTLDRSRTVPRWLPPALAVSAAMALLTGGAVALRPLGAPPAPQSAVPATDLSTAPPALSEPPTPLGPPQMPPAPRTDPGNGVTFLDAATAARLRGMTITLPPWPDESLRPYCPAGRFRFVDGKAPTGGPEQPPGRGPWTYLVLFKGLRGIMANVDGRLGDEIVFPMGCGDIENVFRLLVVKPDGGQLRALGYVADSRHMPGHDRYFAQGGDLVVEVSSDPMSQSPEQRRRYRWQGSRFVQVGGPASFPPAGDIDFADLRNGSFVMFDLSREPDGQGNFSAALSFVDGVSGLWPYRSEEFTHPGADFVLGAMSTGRLTEPDDIPRHGADALVTLTCRWDDGRVDRFVYRVSATGIANAVVRTGADGVTGVVSHRIVDGLAEVTVTTAAGQEIRRYRSTGYVFIREH